MRNADMPAMPQTDEYRKHLEYYLVHDESIGEPPTEGAGLTKRERFCLEMGVAATGDPELDAIIRAGNRQRHAALAMQGMLSRYDFLGEEEDAAAMSVRFADALLDELERSQ